MKKSELKVIDVLPEISDLEIESMMDFEELYTKYELERFLGIPLSSEAKQIGGLELRTFKGLLILISLGAIGGLLYFLLHKAPNVSGNSDISYTTGEATVDESKRIEPIEVPGEKEYVEFVPNTNSNNENELEESSSNLDRRSSQEIKNVVSGYQPAVPTEGYEFLYEFFARELQYPEDARADSVEGTLNIEFSITREGDIINIELKNSLSTNLDAEALRMVKNMPKWNPATLNGKPVESRLSIPLNFMISKETQQ